MEKIIESRCGILCSECNYRDEVNCKGCVNIAKPFWGDICPVKSCCEEKKLSHCGECKTFPVIYSNNFPMMKNREMTV